MFLITLADGTEVTGDKVHWHDLPVNIEIKSVGARIAMERGGVTMMLADEVLEGFDQYGFQMYQLHAADGTGLMGQGLQFIAVRGDIVVTVDVNLTNGRRTTTVTPFAAMTYRRDLLRRGVSRAH